MESKGERLVVIALVGLVAALAVLLCAKAWASEGTTYRAFVGPSCEWCGATNSLEVHHVTTQANIKRQVRDGKITIAEAERLTNHDPENLVTLDRRCHWIMGHCADRWSTENPYIKKQIEANKKGR